MPEIKKPRNSSMEILRILAMLFIVVSHYAVHGGFDYNSMAFSLNKIVLQSCFLGSLGVAIFVMITGYYNINSHYSFKKILRLLILVFFYSSSIFTIYSFVLNNSFSLTDFFYSYMPTIFRIYWFFTAYIVLYIFSPYINKMIRGMSQTLFLRLIFTMLFLWGVIPTITNIYTESEAFFSTELPLFLLYYCIGAYMRLYPNNVLNKRSIGLSMVIGGFLGSIFLLLALNLIGQAIPLYSYNATSIYSRNSIITIVWSLGFIIFFSNLHVKDNAIINYIASCCFGVYLIHDNPYVRDYLWNTIVQPLNYSNSYLLLFHIIFVAICIFVVCAFIDTIRNVFIGNPVLYMFNKHYDKLKAGTISKLKKIYKWVTKEDYNPTDE